jgi:hypothetical protein
MTMYLHFRVSTQWVKLCQVVSVHAMEAHTETGGGHVAPLILFLGTRSG